MSCHQIVYPPCPVPECPEQIVYASENGNLNGIGVLDSNTSSLGTFRGVVGDGTYISTTLDAGNKSVVVSLIAAAIPAAIPQATETVAGKGEVATQAETNAGVSDVAFVTPLKLGARLASSTQAGLIETATQPETFAGASDAVAVTPLRLAQRLATQFVQQVFGNDADRNAAVPFFDGQVGVQLDTNALYVATGLAAGNWQQSYIQANTITTFTADTTFHTDTATTFALGTSGVDYFEVGFDAGPGEGYISILNNAWLKMATGSKLVFGLNTILDLNATTVLQIDGTEVPALSLLGTSGTLGRPTSYTQASFLGAHSLVAWAIPTGTADRTTFDTATVTLPELAERFFALLEDLNNLSIPSY